MGMNSMIRAATLTCIAALLALPAMAANVKVTPLGGQEGEFCPQDRALVFEDPNGTRILYDPGRTVAGATDPRLGKIDIILVTHMHGDHLGNAHNKAPNSGSCASPDMSVSAIPNSNAVNIALAKKAKIVTGSEMPPFFAGKLKANGGDPKNSILARFGGSVMKTAGSGAAMAALAGSPTGRQWEGVAASADGGTVLAVEPAGVWLSTDAGASFANVAPAPNVTVSWYSAAVSATGARLAVSGSGGAGGLMSGGVWVSIDAGQTWTAQLIDRSYQALAMSLAD